MGKSHAEVLVSCMTLHAPGCALDDGVRLQPGRMFNEGEDTLIRLYNQTRAWFVWSMIILELMDQTNQARV